MTSKQNPPPTEGLISSIVTVPNILSAFRILLVPLFVASLLTHKTLEPLFIFFVAGISDLFDGFIARHLHQRSRLGAILDPTGDKLLMAASYIVRPNRIPLWLTALVFGRDLMIVGGVFWAYLSFKHRPDFPTIVGKVCTAFQVGTVFLVLLTNHLGAKAGWLIIFFGITAALTLTSGVQYFRRGLRILRDRNSAEAN
jgi:cardiolipin synthase